MENIKNTPQIKSEAVVHRCSVNKVLLEISQNSQENTRARVLSFLIKLQPSACDFIKKEAVAQVCSCKFCEVYKSTFFQRTLLVVASVKYKFMLK